ncbi:TetR/AcrR family transcriptional regulator [Actinocorallia lasiicapitis]
MTGQISADIHDRILDAAADCLAEGGFTSNRLLSAIARRAGLSRPTLYKHAGTLDDIKDALIARELTTFLAELEPRIAETTWHRDSIIDLLVFVTSHARSHPLLRAALRDVPELVLPWFTTNASAAVAGVTHAALPLVQARIDEGEMPPCDVPLLLDAVTRTVLSLIFVNTPIDADDPAALRTYLHTVAAVFTPFTIVPKPSPSPS